MWGGVKFLVGAAMTVGLALFSVMVLKTSDSFIDRRQEAALIALGEAEGMGVSVDFDRSHGLTRVAILSGSSANVDPATRARLLATLARVPGVAKAQWHDQSDPAAIPGLPIGAEVAK